MNIFKGRRKKSFCVKIGQQGLTKTVYHLDRTTVTTVSNDGNVEVTVEPP